LVYASAPSRIYVPSSLGVLCIGAILLPPLCVCCVCVCVCCNLERVA
jgi:hypothetical protein